MVTEKVTWSNKAKGFCCIETRDENNEIVFDINKVIKD
jgi:cold shock CspA family protein